MSNLEFPSYYVVDNNFIQDGDARLYVAVDTRSRKKHIIKVWELDADPSEISFLLRLRHHGIIEAFEKFTTSNCQGVVLDYIEISLRNYLQETTFMPEDMARNVTFDVISGLQYIHEHFVCLNSISLESIFLRSKEIAYPNAVITHFDSAFEFDQGSMFGLQCRNDIYDSPEVLQSNQCNEKIDMFAYGVVLFCLLIGQSPFAGKSNLSKTTAILTGDYDFSAEQWQYISEDALDFVRALLDPEPLRRPSSMQCLAFDWIASKAQSTIKTPDTSQFDDYVIDIDFETMDIDCPIGDRFF